MASTILIKRRIQTASNVSKTTRAMQMIATSKLKKAQNAATSSRPYVEKLMGLSKTLTDKLEEDDLNEYMIEPKDINDTLLLVFSPDKGLCGGLITNLARELINQNKEIPKIKYVTVGKKIENTTARLGKEILASFNFGTTLPIFDIVYPMAKIIDDYFLNKKVSNVKVLYTHFLTVFSQAPRVETILPIKIQETDEGSRESSQSTLFEPSPKEILSSLLRHYLEMVLYQYLLESYASEQAARMIAMKGATDNAEEIIDYLKLEYNKQRQEKIISSAFSVAPFIAIIL